MYCTSLAIRGRKLGKCFFHVGKRENKFSHVGKTRKNENLPYDLDETLKTLIKGGSNEIQSFFRNVGYLVFYESEFLVVSFDTPYDILL